MSNITLWTRRDPFTEFDALVRRANGSVATRTAGFTPAAELTRDGDDAVLRLELPGLDAEKDVSVEIRDNRLHVSGERRDARSEDSGNGRLREVRYGSFHRSFALPAHVTAESVAASYDAGVLTVKVTGAYVGRDAQRIPVTTGERAAVEA
jgi:HSP20 family protein